MPNNHIRCLSVLTCFLVNLVGLHGQDVSGKNLVNIRIIEPWKDTTIKLIGPGAAASPPAKSKSLDVTVKRAVYEIVPKPEPGKGVDTFSVLLVPDPFSKKKVFIEGEHSFYVADSAGMKGYTLGPGTLPWSSSYFEFPESTDSASAITRFEAEFDPQQLQQQWASRATNRINFQQAFPKFYFSYSSQAGDAIAIPSLDEVELTDGVLHLDIRNPQTQARAHVQLDFRTKKVLKSVVNGQEMDLRGLGTSNAHATPLRP